MALTKDQWYAKLKTWVPSWYFEGEEKTVCFTRGTFKGFAAILSQISQDCDDQVNSTYIMNAADVAPIVDLHGAERNLTRNGEIDSVYKPRIRDSLFKPVGSVQLAAAVNAVLVNGPAALIDNSSNGFFDDDNSTAVCWDDTAQNARWLESQKWYNWWTLIIPNQPPAQEDSVLTAVIAAIEANRAFGTTYDVLYLNQGLMIAETGEQLISESGDILITEDSQL